MACDICKDLIACPMGSRRRVPIGKARYPRFVDHYGRNFVAEDPLMTIDKYPDKIKCFIRQSYCDENSVHYDFRIDGIKFCPFCGGYLLGERELAPSVIREYSADGSFIEYEEGE